MPVESGVAPIGADAQAAERAVKGLLVAIGEDPEREGLRDTPRRVAKFYREFLQPQNFTLTTFENEGYDDPIIEFGIPFYSLCEHHMLPFFGTGTVAYIPGERIVGISKLARVLDHFSRRLQNQERITTHVARYLMEQLQAQGVGVVLSARHMCMEARGARAIGAQTVTSEMLGLYSEHQELRDNLLYMHRRT